LHAAAARALRARGGERLALDDGFQIAFHLRAAEPRTRPARVLPELLSRLCAAASRSACTRSRLGASTRSRTLPREPERDRLRIELLERAVDAADRLGSARDSASCSTSWPTSSSIPSATPSRSDGSTCCTAATRSARDSSASRAACCATPSTVRQRRPDARASEALRRLCAGAGATSASSRRRARSGSEALELAQTDLQRALTCIALGTVDVLEDRFEAALQQAERRSATCAASSVARCPEPTPRPTCSRRARTASWATRRAPGLGAPRGAPGAQAGERRLEAEATARLGGLLLDADRAEEAEARLREALLLAEEIEDRRGQALARLFLGILLWEASDAEARAMLESAGELALQMGLNRVERSPAPCARGCTASAPSSTWPCSCRRAPWSSWRASAPSSPTASSSWARTRSCCARTTAPPRRASSRSA
jgi:tetratricopeptide (TPR) repeat protein